MATKRFQVAWNVTFQNSACTVIYLIKMGLVISCQPITKADVEPWTCLGIVNASDF